MEPNGAQLNGHDQSMSSAQPGRRRDRIQQRHQAAQLQRFAFDAAMALKAKCTDKESGKVVIDVKTAVAVQKLIGAWDTAADRLRVLRGRGLPAVVRYKPRAVGDIQPLRR